MVEIKHAKSGDVFLSVDTDSLVRANLMGEYLIHADLSECDLSGAKLVFANLSGANMRNAKLIGTNLRGANLTEVDLTGADFRGSDLTGATFSLTTLDDCHNLHLSHGLNQVLQPGPSMINAVTLGRSIHAMSDVFLQSAGFTRSEIVLYRQLFDKAMTSLP